MAENKITNPDHPDHPEWGPQNRRKAREARDRKAFQQRIADSMDRYAHVLDRLADGGDRS